MDLDLLNALRTRAGLPALDCLPPPTKGFLCPLCDAEMPVRVWACAPCRAKDRANIRAEVTSAALASVPAIFRSATVGSERVRRFVAPAALAQALDARCSILIGGAAGAGKSTLAAALILRAINTDHPRAGSCRWAAADDVVRWHSEHALGRGTAPELAALERAELVVLDDLGAEHATQTNPAIDALIHHRHRAGLRTIVTTGLTIAQITTRYGAGIVRRLLDRALVISL